MALSLSGPETPPLFWKGGNRRRRSFKTSVCPLSLMLGLSLPSQAEGSYPGLGKQQLLNPTSITEPVPVQPSSSPGQLQKRKKEKERTKFFFIKRSKGPWDTPPSPILVRRPMSSLGDHQLVPVSVLGLCVGEGD